MWDTALAVLALTDTGLAPDHPALVRAGQWILQEEITTTGDWAVRRPHLRPGGWAFEFANDTYPDIDDTAIVAMALRRLVGGGTTATRRPARAHERRPAGTLTSRHLQAAVGRGVEWVVGMRSRDGGWGAFDADNTQNAVRSPALLRLRGGHRPPQRRRDRARGRDARRGPRRRTAR